MQRKLYSVAVIGCGRWGTFIAKYLSDVGHAVTLYGRAGSSRTEELLSTRRNALMELPAGVALTTSLNDAVKADVLVVSATPQAAVEREWANQGLAPLVQTICGQEFGTKRQSLAFASQYPENHALMIGDAPGDYKAALANNALFFPINPGEEEASWKRFYEEGVDKFLGGEFAGDYQQALLDDFDAHLPIDPPWKTLD